jgi:uncharacterized lipoprotein
MTAIIFGKYTMKKYLLYVLLTITLSACSTKQWYEVGQGQQKSECIKKAKSESQYNKCLDSEKKSYEDYEKERKLILKK